MNETIYKISWERYLIQIAIWLVIVSILLGLKGVIGWYAFIPALLWTLWMGVQVAENYVTKLIIDDEGVWVYSGIFPWNKGRYGLNWRDISGATYKTGFLSWILKSYAITIKHRYTMDSHLIFPSVHLGNKMVEMINHIVAEKDLY